MSRNRHDNVRRHVKQIPHNLALEARVHCRNGTARAGSWTWSVRAAKTRREIARSLRPYVRRFHAEQGARRAYPSALLVE
jgi:hypothetical protein